MFREWVCNTTKKRSCSQSGCLNSRAHTVTPHSKTQQVSALLALRECLTHSSYLRTCDRRLLQLTLISQWRLHSARLHPRVKDLAQMTTTWWWVDMQDEGTAARRPSLGPNIRWQSHSGYVAVCAFHTGTRHRLQQTRNESRVACEYVIQQKRSCSQSGCLNSRCTHCAHCGVTVCASWVKGPWLGTRPFCCRLFTYH